LKAADNVDGDVYAPSTLTGEAYFELEQKIQVVKQEIEALIGRELVFAGLQDTSCIEELNLHHHMVTSGPLGPWLDVEFNIRFSNFSNFVAIVENPNFKSISHPIKKVIEILESHGFVYIPNDILELEYKGRYRDLLDEPTWWDRFFM
jgi:hypothetical protein